VGQADAVDDTLKRCREARRHDTAVAPGRRACDLLRFQHHHVIAAPRKTARGPQSGEAAADDTYAGIDLGEQLRPWLMRLGPHGIKGLGSFFGHGLVISWSRRGLHTRFRRRAENFLYNEQSPGNAENSCAV